MSKNMWCNKCAFITFSVQEAIVHVQKNRSHKVLGEGSDGDSTIEVSIA